jgi:hypothetical protein
MINPESATMKFKGESRGFSEGESESVRRLMDLVGRYAVESTIWWEQGLGERLDEHGNPIPGQKKPDKKESSPAVRASDVAVTDKRDPTTPEMYRKK